MPDTLNMFAVGMMGYNDGFRLRIMRASDTQMMTRDEALNLAAWLVALADPKGDDFFELLKAVKAA